MEVTPYEISIWTDYLDDSADLSYDQILYKENKYMVIGSDTMTSNCRAISPKFTKKITGEYTLEFTLYTLYFNEDSNEYEDNPFISLISNETKLKLKYNDEWYDFIVKMITESSDLKSYLYTAEALFINELSKNGFGLVFDAELENSTGSIQELVANILEETDWVVDTDESELILQSKEEPLFKLKVKTAFTPKYRTIENGEIKYNDGPSITAEKYIYAFYSVITNRSDFFLFLYREDDIYELDDDGVITNSECYYIDKTFDFDIDFPVYFDIGTLLIDDLVVDEKRGDRLVLTSETVYDSRLDKYVSVYKNKIDSKIYYGYTTTEYKTSEYVQNIITNPSDFKSRDGWETINDLYFDTEVYPPILNSQGELNEGSTQYLKITPTISGKNIYNTGFTDNRRRFIPSDDNGAGGIKLGETWVLREFIYLNDGGTSGTESKPASTPTFQEVNIILYDDIEELDPDNIILKFTAVDKLSRYYRVSVNSEEEFEKGTYYIYNSSTESFNLATSYSATERYYILDNLYIDKTLIPVSYSDLLSKKVGVFITLTSGTTYWIKQVDIFPYLTNTEGDVVTPDPVAIDGYYVTDYYYYDRDEYKEATTAEEIKTIKSEGGPNSDYILQYDESYEKKRSYEASESNRLNMIEELCELFECWAEFKINHNENGSIHLVYIDTYTEIEISEEEFEPYIYYYKDSLGNYKIAVVWQEDVLYYTKRSTPRYDKSVIIKNFVGKDNYAGFKYGINLKSVRRELDSAELVSKIIVKDNSNDYATDGYCSISRAKENPCGENFLYDFRHYYNTGLLNYALVVNDLYTYYDTEACKWLGYYKRMKKINSNRQTIIDEIAILENKITNLEASIQSYDALKTESANEYTESLVYVNEFKTPFTYKHYIGEDTTYDPGTELGESYDTSSDPLKNFRGVYISLNDVTDPQEGDTVIIYNSSTPTIAAKQYDYTTEWELLKSIALKKYHEELTSLKKNSKLLKYLTSVNTASTWEKKYSELYDQYYYSLYGRGDPDDPNYIKGVKTQEEELEKELEEIKAQKEKLNALFYAKYSRFIQEGSWTDDSYTDDNLYYYDAEAVLATSAQPQVSYTISALELSQLEEYEGYTFDVGDKTTIEDTEFFGWTTVNGVKTPYKEEVIISEITWNLTNPESNTIKIQNYKTRFEDLFLRIAASTTALEFASGSYNTAASAVTTTGAIVGTSLQNAFNQNAITVSNIKDQTVVWDDTGITIFNNSDSTSMLRLYNGGILIYNGSSWDVGISSAGINANYLNVGQIDVSKVRIMNGLYSTYYWDINGLSAFAFSLNSDGSISSINANQYTRFDLYGFYGIKNQADFIPSSINDVLDKASYGLTWGGFFLKAFHEDDTAIVKISDTEDIVLKVKNGDDYIDRIKIGVISKNASGNIYGMALRNSTGERTLYTSDNGTLWLSNKLIVAADGTTAESALAKIGYLDEYRLQISGTTTYYIKKLGSDEYIELLPGYIYHSGVTYYIYDSSTEEYVEVSSVPTELNHEIIHTGLTTTPLVNIENLGTNRSFTVYEDGTLYATGAYINGAIYATSGKIGNLEVSEVGSGFKALILPLNGNEIWDHEISTLKCMVTFNGGEVDSNSEYLLSYNWFRGSDTGLISLENDEHFTGATSLELVILTSAWTEYAGETDTLYFTCDVTIQTNLL